MVDEQKLRQLAEAATPGPWVTGNTDPLLFGSPRNPGTEPIGFVYGPSFAERSELGRKALSTSEYIATANPAAILSLLDELQSLRNDRDSWADQCSQRVADAVDALEKLEAMTQERTAWRVTAENAEEELAALKASLGEPLAWLSVDSIGERYLCFSKPLDRDHAAPLYALTNKDPS